MKSMTPYEKDDAWLPRTSHHRRGYWRSRFIHALVVIVCLSAGCTRAPSGLVIDGGARIDNSPAPDLSAPTTKDQALAPAMRVADFTAAVSSVEPALANKAALHGPVLNYNLKVYVDVGFFRGGQFRIFYCGDMTCSNRRLAYVIQCSDQFQCVATDGDSKRIVKGSESSTGFSYAEGGSDLVSVKNSIYTVSDDGHSVNQAIDLSFVDPRILRQGNTNQYLMADLVPDEGTSQGDPITRLSRD